MFKKLLFLNFFIFIITFTLNTVNSIEPDIFVQSTVNRASETLSQNNTKDERIEEHTPEELEEALRYQLLRLESFQKVSKIIYSRSLVGRDVFYGGSSEGLNIKYDILY